MTGELMAERQATFVFGKSLAVVIGVTRRDVASLMKRRPRPPRETDCTGAQASLGKSIAAFDYLVGCDLIPRLRDKYQVRR